MQVRGLLKGLGIGLALPDLPAKVGAVATHGGQDDKHVTGMTPPDQSRREAQGAKVLGGRGQGARGGLGKASNLGNLRPDRGSGAKDTRRSTRSTSVTIKLDHFQKNPRVGNPPTPLEIYSNHIEVYACVFGFVCLNREDISSPQS